MSKYLTRLVTMVMMAIPGHTTDTDSFPIRASYYSHKFDGKLMANGEPFNSKIVSAASKTFPLGTLVSITSLKTGKSIIVPITDRGPYSKKFKLDLSLAAFKELGLNPKSGWGWVTVKKV